MRVSTFEGVIHVNTPKAVLFECVYWDGTLWLPRSQIEIDPDAGGLFVVVHVKDWLVRKRGLLEFTQYSAEEIAKMGEQ